MAIYRHATQKLIKPGSNDPKIKPRVGILHVDAGDATSLYDYFLRRSGGIESHFHIPKKYKIEQYRDTDYEADANYQANPFALSFETQGLGKGKWNAHQIAEIKAAMIWCYRKHKIPFRKVTSWNDPVGGWGYHTLFGAPSKWTPVPKSCPGPDRIIQFHSELVPWLEEQDFILRHSSKAMDVDIQHTSLQFNDTLKQKKTSVEVMFSLGSNVVTWTEAGDNNDLYALVQEVGEKYGYDVWAHPNGDGVAVHRKFGKILEKGYDPGAPAIKGNPRGIAWVTVQVGKETMTFGSVHYFALSRVKNYRRWRAGNKKIAAAAGSFVERAGEGRKLVFLNGDFNMDDRKVDVFFGGPLLTCWDELDKYPGTHGKRTIDAVASFVKDVRVECISAKTIIIDDFLDHKTVLAKYRIK